MKKSKKSKKSQTYKPRSYNTLNRKSKKILSDEFTRLSNTAYARMKSLEKWVEKEPEFKSVLTWGYRLGKKAIARMYGENAKSFKRKAPDDKETLIKNISEIEKFLSMPTTTKTGVIEIFKKRADKLNKNYGTDFSWEDLATFFESANYEKNEKAYGSEVYLMAVGKIQKYENEIIESIKEKRKINLHIEDKAVSETVDKLIKNYGVKVVNLYSNE